jgi:signal transduction histidine kinase
MQSRVWTEPGRVAVAAAFCAGAAIIGLLAAPTAAPTAARADEAAGSEQTSKQTSEPARAPSAPLRVVYNPSPPFAITDSQGRADGFGIDILKIIAANAGYALSFREVMNIAEALDLIEAGQADIHPALATNAARREIMSYSSPIGAVRLRLYARADRAATLDPDDLTGARIGSLQGGTTMMAAQSIIGAISTPRQSARDQVAGLEDGSLDLAVFVESAFDALRRAYAPNTRFVSVGPPVQSTPIGIAVTNRLPEALALLDAALHDLKSEARFAELSQRWFGPPPSWWSVERLIWAAIGAIGAVLAAAGLLIQRLRATQRRQLLAESVKREALARAHAAAQEEKTKELALQNEEMERLLQAVSHDLKSPIVTVRGFASLLEEAMESGDDASARDACRRIMSSTRRLGGITDGLLEVSRADRKPIDPVAIDLNLLVDEVADMLSATIAQAGATVTMPDRLPMAWADRSQMLRVMLNLIANALHHGCPRPGMRVEVTARQSDAATEIIVRDHGPGIPEEFQRDVFRLFRRLGEDRRDGSGIGLSIVATIAAKHDGTSWASSPPGGGAALHVSVPTRAHAWPAEHGAAP